MNEVIKNLRALSSAGSAAWEGADEIDRLTRELEEARAQAEKLRVSRDHWKVCAGAYLTRICEMKAESATTPGSTTLAVMPTQARMACVRNNKVHIFLTDTAAREWLIATGNDWSFAGWVDGIEWHPASSAAPDSEGEVVRLPVQAPESPAGQPTTKCVCDCGNPLRHVWLYWWKCNAGHVWQVYDRERQDGGEARESGSPLVADLVNEIDRLKRQTDYVADRDFDLCVASDRASREDKP